MQLGEVIAELVRHCANEDAYLMARTITSIEIQDDSIIVYFKDSNTMTLKIKVS